MLFYIVRGMVLCVSTFESLDCFVALLLAMTGKNMIRHSRTVAIRSDYERLHSRIIAIRPDYERPTPG